MWKMSDFVIERQVKDRQQCKLASSKLKGKTMTFLFLWYCNISKYRMYTNNLRQILLFKCCPE